MPNLRDTPVIGALADPLRRRLYRFVAERRDEVSRDEAAEALDLPLSKAKFHLDRLAEAGLLEVSYRRLTGRQGPGSGRPAKLYRRAEREFTVSLPERRYDVMGGVLADAVERTQHGVPLDEAIRVAAHERGVTDGADAGVAEDRPSSDSPLSAAAETLNALGYETGREDDDRLRLRNCPFDALVQQHRELVCSTNRQYVQGVLDGAGYDTVEARLEPHSGYCCVIVYPSASRNAVSVK